MKIVAWSDLSGAKFWRFHMPFRFLNANGHEAYISDNDINDEELIRADVILLHNVVSTEGIASALAYARSYNKRLIVDVDDALFTTDSNPYKKDWDRLDATFILKQTIKQADLITVSTETLKKELLKYNKNIIVLENSYDPSWLPRKIVKNEDSRFIRLGWTGSITHIDDFKMIVPVLNELLDEHKNLKLILCGDPRFKALIKHTGRVEMYQPVPIESFMHRLNSMALDIGIAPVINNKFNKCKSQIKWLEYSLLKIPSVCSKFLYPNASLGVRSLKEWKRSLNKLIEDENLRKAVGNIDHDKASKYSLDKRWKKWEDAYGR